ncbi:MAG TPA: aminotransferase class V-fold PLP-dependent enzyme [Rhizobiales bacterium]|nr:aminotransferase class V-fold PLP-dependent enzyme [Hyphomicrobiales bacterium]
MPTSATGRYFLQVPGPTIIPDRVAAAMSMPALDHRGPVFAQMAAQISEDLKSIFKTSQPVMIFPSSGTGAWQVAMVNTLSAGDKVLICETGHFSFLWKTIARDLGLEVQEISGDWRSGIDAGAVEDVLRSDQSGEIKAVLAVHNETATGVTSDIQALRRAMDRSGHGALLFVDTISSLCAVDYAHDDWGVDVTICGSQKGFMLPPGLSFTVASEKALEAAKSATLPRGYFRWEPMIEAAGNGLYPYTPPVTLFYGLRESLVLLREEGLENVFARHARLAAATRAAVTAWGFEIQCQNPHEYSNAVTAVRLPDGYNADTYRAKVLEKFDMSLAAGLGKIAGKVFRIGHLGYMNALTLAGALAGVEMGFKAADIPYKTGGILAAMEILNQE